MTLFLCVGFTGSPWPWSALVLLAGAASLAALFLSSWKLGCFESGRAPARRSSEDEELRKVA